MNNFSEKLNKLQESVGLEKTNFSQSYIAFLYDDGSGELVTAMTKYDGKSEMKKVALDFINKGLDGDDLAKASDIKKIQKFDDHDKAEEWMDDEGRKHEHKNFSEDQGVDTQVTDEASARALGESLAKKMWGDKFDQKIFDGVFATALEQCGENWDHVAAYLRKVYQGASKMNNFSERLNSLQESLGLEKTKLETQTPAVTTTATPATETPSAQAEVTRTQEGSSTPAPVQPANLSEKPKTETKETVTEAICPKCGRVPCECVTHTVTLDFSNLTDEEFAEIAKEAQEYAKYPEQYETEGDRINSFTSWLQNSRFKDFCNEALYKAFCGLKK